MRRALKIVAYLHDQAAIRSILDQLGLTPPESERPPPGVRYVPVDDGGRETAATAWVADGPQAGRAGRSAADGPPGTAVVCPTGDGV